MRNFQPGQRVFRWTILCEAASSTCKFGHFRRRWLCQCDCGTTKLVLEQSLRLALCSNRGGSRSCGCLAAHQATRHGHTRGGRPSPEYAVWIAAKKRCRNPSNPSFLSYGGRGIRVCRRWEQSFEAFLHDMGRKPAPGFSLDRIDPDGDYEPVNCRWASIEVQNRNRKGIRWYEFEGQPALIKDIARFLGISRDEARALERRGLLPARRLTEVPRVPDRIVPLVLDLNKVAPYPKPDEVQMNVGLGDDS
jgi:hypothetical protein